MSRQVDLRVVEPGDDDHVDVVWALKERIREHDGALKQGRRYFEREYRRYWVYLLFETTDRSRLVAFAVIHGTGYLSLLGVNPQDRRRGVGTRLLERLRENHTTVRCHTRASKQGIVDFYEQAGFSVGRRLEDYYRDGDDAVELRLESGGGG